MKVNTRSLLQFVVLLSIGILLIWLSFRQVAPEKERIFEAFRNADYFWIGVSMTIALLSHFLRAYRWNFLLEPVGYRADLLNATCYVLIGYLANYGIPRMGEVSRCTLATKYDKVPFEVGFGTVITERIVDFFIFIFIFFLTLAFQFNELIGLANKLVFDKLREKLAGSAQHPAGLITLIAVMLLFVGALYLLRKKFAVFFKGKLGGIIKGMMQGIGSIRKMKRPWAFVAWSLIIWTCYFYSVFACFYAMGATSHLGHKECLTILLFGTLGVIFSPGGLGAYPAIVGGILLFTYNIPTAYAFSMPWLAWTSQFVVVMSTGIICLIVLPIYNRKRNVVSPATQL